MISSRGSVNGDMKEHLLSPPPPTTSPSSHRVLINADPNIDMSSPLYSRNRPPPPSFPGIVPFPPWYVTLLLVAITAFVIVCYTVPSVEQAVINDFFRTSRCRVTEIGSLPLISIVFTYVHIYAALWMTFYPLKYVGCLRLPGTNLGLGWQGIVPFKAAIMGEIAVDLMTRRLLDVEGIFRKVKPDQVAAHLTDTVHSAVQTLTDNLGHKHAPQIWASLSPTVREALCEEIGVGAPSVISEFLHHLQRPGVLLECVNVKQMLLSMLEKDDDLLNQIFIRCGAAELCFIRNAGAWMGGLFGLLQAILYIYYDAPWVLPTAGLIVGCITNWLALQMIFRPVHPVHIPIPWPRAWGFACCRPRTKPYNTVVPLYETCGKSCGIAEIVLHGLFLSRQMDVAAEYGRTISQEVLSSQALISNLLTGPKNGRVFELVHYHIQRHFDKVVTQLTPSPMSASAILGEQTMSAIQFDVTQQLLRLLPLWLTRSDVLRLLDDSLDFESELSEKLASIGSEEFESLLHPVFQEDEWKLVLMGGMLGVAIGLMQTYLINTGSCA